MTNFIIKTIELQQVRAQNFVSAQPEIIHIIHSEKLPKTPRRNIPILQL